MSAAPESADEAFAYIERFVNLERGSYKPREYRLERMERLLSDFGDPQADIPTVHIAGSKGKGSTASFVEAGLRSLGLKTGLYASPHISDYRERFCIDGSFAVDYDIVEETARIYEHVEPLRSLPDAAERLPTTFELLTLLAFLLFRRAECDWIVLETGLGGRLDATNLCRPDLCLITPIELEHTEYLGTDLTSIAREKAGIFKNGIPVLLSRQTPEAERELLRVAASRHCPVRRLDDEVLISDIRVDPGGTHATVRLTGSAGRHSPVKRAVRVSRDSMIRHTAPTQRDTGVKATRQARSRAGLPSGDPDDPRNSGAPEYSRNSGDPDDPRNHGHPDNPHNRTTRAESVRLEMRLNLNGAAQAENAALALLAVLAICPDASPDRVLAGLCEAKLPGRAEFVSGRPPFLLDGAHTAGSVRRLMQTARSVLPPDPVLLFGAVRGKDIGGMVSELAGHCRSVVVSRAGTFKPSDPDEIAREFTDRGFEVYLEPEPVEAVERARTRAGAEGGIVVTGSFYLVAAIRAVLKAEGTF